MNMKETKTNIKDYSIRNAVFELMPTEKSSGYFHEEIPGTDLSIAYAIDLKEAGMDFVERKVMSSDSYGLKTKIKKAAKDNTEKIRPMNIFRLKDVVNPEDDDASVLVVTTSTCFHGAAAILYPETDEKIRNYEGFEDGYYIIPSSIHEVLVVAKTTELDANALKEMVIDINKSEVEPEVFLSNNIFELVDGKLKVVC